MFFYFQYNVFIICALNNIVTLKSGLRVTQGL